MGDAFDLRRFAPPKSITVTLQSGQQYEFTGDPDTDDVARMLRLEEEIADANGPGLADRIDEGKALIDRMALKANPAQDVQAMRVGASEMIVLFALLLHGETVAEAIAANLAPPADSDDTAGDDMGGEGESGPLAAAAETLASV